MRALLVSLALGAAAISNAAAAQTVNSDTFNVAIPYADLNLASQAGVETLKGRVRAEANRICGNFEVYPLERSAAIAECKAQMLQSAERQLTATFASSGGRYASLGR